MTPADLIPLVAGLVAIGSCIVWLGLWRRNG